MKRLLMLLIALLGISLCAQQPSVDPPHGVIAYAEGGKTDPIPPEPKPPARTVEQCDDDLDGARAATVSLQQRLNDANARITQLEAQLLKPQVAAQRKAQQPKIDVEKPKDPK